MAENNGSGPHETAVRANVATVQMQADRQLLNNAAIERPSKNACDVYRPAGVGVLKQALAVLLKCILACTPVDSIAPHALDCKYNNRKIRNAESNYRSPPLKARYKQEQQSKRNAESDDLDQVAAFLQVAGCQLCSNELSQTIYDEDHAQATQISAGFAEFLA